MVDRQTPSDRALDKRRFDEAIAAYIAGTLSSEDQLFFSQYLADHPEAASSVLFATQIANAVRQIGSERDQVKAATQFTKSLLSSKFKKPVRKSGVSAPKPFFTYKPWMAVFLLLFFLENGFLFYENRSHHLVNLSENGGGIIMAQADARFVLNDRAPLDQFFDVAQKYNAVIIYSENTPKGPEIHIDMEDESQVLALADELANNAVIKPSETKIAVLEFGRRAWVQRVDAKPQMLAVNQTLGH